jgi:hypothetical protein
MIPLYGFLEGDTLGLLVLADPEETVGSLAEKLERSASVRVTPRSGSGGDRLIVRAGPRVLDSRLTVQAAGLQALDRFDVRYQGGGG